MGRVLISSENSFLQNAFGCVVAAIFLPLAIIVKIVVSPFERPMDRTADDVAGHLRAMLDGTIDDYDYDEFSCVPIADPRLESIARRACEAFELRPDKDRAALETLLAETEALSEKG
jgi:hypothetical protein